MALNGARNQKEIDLLKKVNKEVYDHIRDSGVSSAVQFGLIPIADAQNVASSVAYLNTITAANDQETYTSTALKFRVFKDNEIHPALPSGVCASPYMDCYNPDKVPQLTPTDMHKMKKEHMRHEIGKSSACAKLKGINRSLQRQISPPRTFDVTKEHHKIGYVEQNLEISYPFPALDMSIEDYNRQREPMRRHYYIYGENKDGIVPSYELDKNTISELCKNYKVHHVVDPNTNLDNFCQSSTQVLLFDNHKYRTPIDICRLKKLCGMTTAASKCVWNTGSFKNMNMCPNETDPVYRYIEDGGTPCGLNSYHNTPIQIIICANESPFKTYASNYNSGGNTAWNESSYSKIGLGRPLMSREDFEFITDHFHIIRLDASDGPTTEPCKQDSNAAKLNIVEMYRHLSPDCFTNNLYEYHLDMSALTEHDINNSDSAHFTKLPSEPLLKTPPRTPPPSPVSTFLSPQSSANSSPSSSNTTSSSSPIRTTATLPRASVPLNLNPRFSFRLRETNSNSNKVKGENTHDVYHQDCQKNYTHAQKESLQEQYNDLIKGGKRPIYISPHLRYGMSSVIPEPIIANYQAPSGTTLKYVTSDLREAIKYNLMTHLYTYGANVLHHQPSNSDSAMIGGQLLRVLHTAIRRAMSAFLIWYENGRGSPSRNGVLPCYTVQLHEFMDSLCIKYTSIIPSDLLLTYIFNAHRNTQRHLPPVVSNRQTKVTLLDVLQPMCIGMSQSGEAYVTIVLVSIKSPSSQLTGAFRLYLSQGATAVVHGCSIRALDPNAE